MERVVLRLLCFALVAVMVGCSDSGSGTGGGGGSAGVGGGGGTAGDGGDGGSETVTLSVLTTEPQGLAPLGPALPGVELCEADTTNCATTDADGTASIELPANQQVRYTLEKDGYVPVLVGDVTDDMLFQTGPWAMYSDDLVEQLLADLGIDAPTGGQIILRAVSGSVIEGIEGATFDLIGEDATPFYFTQDWMASLDLTATTSVGQGGFVEQDAGEAEIEFGGAATNCSVQIGWPGGAANRVSVPVRVGYISFGTMVCDEP